MPDAAGAALGSGPPGAGPAQDDGALPGIDRLLALSDGVVAIALTLLVLQLHVPAADVVSDPGSASQLANALGHEGDQLISYGISFYVIAQFWLGHHRTFRQMSGHHEGLAWFNFAFLLTITLVPFTSGLLGQYASNPLAVDIFALNLMLASLASTATMVYATRANLLVADADAAAIRAGQIRARAVGSAFAVSLAVAWVSTTAAAYCWSLTVILPIVARRLWPTDPTKGAPRYLSG